MRVTSEVKDAGSSHAVSWVLVEAIRADIRAFDEACRIDHNACRIGCEAVAAQAQAIARTLDVITGRLQRASRADQIGFLYRVQSELATVVFSAAIALPSPATGQTTGERW